MPAPIRLAIPRPAEESQRTRAFTGLPSSPKNSRVPKVLAAAFQLYSNLHGSTAHSRVAALSCLRGLLGPVDHYLRGSAAPALLASSVIGAIEEAVGEKTASAQGGSRSTEMTAVRGARGPSVTGAVPQPTQASSTSGGSTEMTPRNLQGFAKRLSLLVSQASAIIT